jgi:DNA processing protein
VAPAPAIAHAIAQTEAWLESSPMHAIVTLADAAYPQHLLTATDPPPLLFARGRLELLNRPALAIVGSRNATRHGLETASAFAQRLAQAVLTIVSGMALGIDAAAIGERGVLVTEFALGTPGIAHNFPRRNRIIAGLARGALVVEAALRSGSLITARLASEGGREVFAVPGSIHSPMARGCHRLIKDGAKLVEEAADILDELNLPNRPGREAAGTVAAPEPLLDAMGFDPVDLDKLAARTGSDAGNLAAALLELELTQDVERLPGNRYQRLR